MPYKPSVTTHQEHRKRMLWAMHKLDLTIQEVATKAKVGRAALSRFLNGAKNDPRLSFIERVWNAIDYFRQHPKQRYQARRLQQRSERKVPEATAAE